MPNPNLPINYRKNTYIGARYVPKFADTPGSEWDNSIQYEPLTIVLYQGNSFTSKTFVPVGADINNDTYWAETGSYNAQVEAYRKEVLEYKDEVNGLAGGVYYDLPTKEIQFTNAKGMKATVHLMTVSHSYGINLGVSEPNSVVDLVDASFENKASAMINAGIFNTSTLALRGNTIVNGDIISSEKFESGETTPAQVLVIADNGQLGVLDSANLTANQILAAGYKNSVQGWYSTMVNGASTFLGGDSCHGRSAIGQKPNNGDYVFLVCPSNVNSFGISGEDINTILKGEGCDFAYMLDGGGSSAMTNNNFMVNMPSSDFNYRKVRSFLYVGAKTENLDAPVDIYRAAIEDEQQKVYITKNIRFYGTALGIYNPQADSAGIDFFNGFKPNESPVRRGKLGLYNDGFKIVFAPQSGGEVVAFKADEKGISDRYGLFGKFYNYPSAISNVSNVTTGVYSVTNQELFPGLAAGDYYDAFFVKSSANATARGIIVGGSHTYGASISPSGEVKVWLLGQA